MDREQILREQTHKDDGLDTSRRVYYTLVPAQNYTAGMTAADKAAHDAGRKSIAADRTTALLCLLIQHLQERGQLSASELDELLLSTVLP